MRHLVAIGVVLLCGTVCLAERIVQEIFWEDLAEQGKLQGGRVFAADEDAQLKVVNTRDNAATFEIMTIENPPINGIAYALVGEVFHMDVEGKGYLEMVSYLPNGTVESTRALADSGPQRSLEGTSEWRRFVLPFSLKRSSRGPEKIAFNVVLPGRGTVYLGPLRLVEYSQGEDPLTVRGEWLSKSQVQLAGGVFCSVVACLGVLIAILSSGGWARAVVLGMLKFLMIVGVALIVFAILALIQAQSFWICFSAGLAGLVTVGLSAGAFRAIREHYGRLES